MNKWIEKYRDDLRNTSPRTTLVSLKWMDLENLIAEIERLEAVVEMAEVLIEGRNKKEIQ